METYGKTARCALRRGFTIIELMVVIAVIAILATLVTKAAQSSIREARQKDAKLMAQAIKLGIANYHAQFGEWPGVIESLADGGRTATGNPGHPGALSNEDADKVIQLVVEQSTKGNPLLDASGLFVATKNAADAKHGRGLKFGDARRQNVQVSNMAFGYQKFKVVRKKCANNNKSIGDFCRFLIKYDQTNDTVTVKCCEDETSCNQY